MRKKVSGREDNLKLVYTLSGREEVRSSDLADKSGIKRSAICLCLKRLMENDSIILDEQHYVPVPLNTASAPKHIPH